MMSKIWTNGDTIIRLSRKHCGKGRNLLVIEVHRLCLFFEGKYDPKSLWEKEKLLLMSMSNFFFPTVSAEFLLYSFP